MNPIVLTADEVRRIRGKKQTHLIRRAKPDRQCLLPGVHDALCPYGFPGSLLWVKEKWIEYQDKILFKADVAKGPRLSYNRATSMPVGISRLVIRICSVQRRSLLSIDDSGAALFGFSSSSELLEDWRRRHKGVTPDILVWDVGFLSMSGGNNA